MSNSNSNIVVLIGPPNSGKTSLYNHLTGSRFKTVNYPGATVEYSVGQLRKPGDLRKSSEQGAVCCPVPESKVQLEPGSIQIMDTPGIVSLIPRTQDEQVALSALTSLDKVLEVPDPSPHMLIVLVDATQPARHLPLVRQIIATKIPVVVALTMNDLARKAGRAVDTEKLSGLIGVPVVEMDGRLGNGIEELHAWIETIMPQVPIHAVIPTSMRNEEIQENFHWADQISTQVVNGYIIAGKEEHPDLEGLDRIALHPVFGLAVFALIMSGFFWLVFWAAAPMMDFVDGAFSRLGEFAGAHLGAGWLSSLIVDGVIAGAGAVFTFVPQIAVLFLALGVLEDSGYLARGAMLVDRFLLSIGLNGKSFVPLLSGNACAIPAAMSARTIPGRRERLLTLLVIPLMSCSARLPVWGLLLGFLVPHDKPWLGGLALTAIYIVSIMNASVVAVVGGKLLGIKPSDTGFQVELPQWRPPTFRTVVVSAWDRTFSYLQRAGVVIVGVSIAFWLFMNLPSPEHSIAMTVGQWIQPILTPMGVDWRVGVALLAAFAAREVFVSALAVVYAVPGVDDSTSGLLDAMRNATFDGTHHLVFTTASTLGLIVFFMFALQCLTTVAVMRKEVSNKFALGQMFGLIAVAWVLASVTVQALRMAGIA